MDDDSDPIDGIVDEVIEMMADMPGPELLRFLDGLYEQCMMIDKRAVSDEDRQVNDNMKLAILRTQTKVAKQLGFDA